VDAHFDCQFRIQYIGGLYGTVPGQSEWHGS